MTTIYLKKKKTNSNFSQVSLERENRVKEVERKKPETLEF